MSRGLGVDRSSERKGSGVLAGECTPFVLMETLGGTPPWRGVCQGRRGHFAVRRLQAGLARRKTPFVQTSFPSFSLS